MCVLDLHILCLSVIVCICEHLENLVSRLSLGIVFNYTAFDRRRCNCTAILNLVFFCLRFLFVTEKPWSYCGMALQPHVNGHCSTASVAPLGPIKGTKVKFDKFVKAVEVFDSLRKLQNNKNNVVFFDEENKLVLAMARWDGEISGSDRFHDLEGLRRRYTTRLKASYQRLDAWCQENCRLPRLRRSHGGSSETVRDEDCHAQVLRFEGSRAEFLEHRGD